MPDSDKKSAEGHRPSAEDIRRFNEEAFRKLAPPPDNETFNVEGKRLADYLERLASFEGTTESRGIASPDVIRSRMEVLGYHRLAFRGTDGSRIEVEQVWQSLDLLRWEPCLYCSHSHPLVLGMLNDKVVWQVIVCDSKPVVMHVKGK